MSGAQSTERRVEALERELARSRWRTTAVAAAAGVAALLVASDASEAGKAPREIVVVSEDGASTAKITASGIEFVAAGKTRFRVEIGSDYGHVTLAAPDGDVAWTAGNQGGTTAMKIFSSDDRLRVEVADHLIDSGAGVRLYDRDGAPRTTLFTDRREGECGIEITDANRQPRVDMFAEPHGATVLRASTSGAEASAELSLLPESDLVARQTGAIPEPRDGEPLVPMLYLQDRTGMGRVLSIGSP